MLDDNLPYWMEIELPRRAKLDRDLAVDVVVVGGGFTGITTAYLLRKEGLSVALLERDRFAMAYSGHTTAHVTQVTDKRLSELTEVFGEDRAKACWDAGHAAMLEIEHIVERERIRCGFKRVDGYLHASLQKDGEDERKAMRKEAELASSLGFAATYLESTPLVGRPGVLFPNQSKLHPLLYLGALLDILERDGCHVFEESEVTSFHDEPLKVEANGHGVSCGYIVIATHVPLVGLSRVTSATLLQAKLALYSTYVVGARIDKGRAPEALFWDTSRPYYYLRVDALDDHDYVIFGGEDHKTGQISETGERFQRLADVLSTFLPGARVDHHWSGQVIETNDGLPFIGETAEKQFAITGFSGNGITFGTFGAMLARDAALSKGNPWASLFDIHRTKIKGGTWSYLRENADYPYYMLRDRLARPEAASVTELAKGQSAILKVDGKRMAAHRREDGAVELVSAICPHLGCIVHWNDSERTWDCPCHGSRFKPNGELLAGPAETSLTTLTSSGTA